MSARLLSGLYVVTYTGSMRTPLRRCDRCGRILPSQVWWLGFVVVLSLLLSGGVLNDTVYSEYVNTRSSLLCAAGFAFIGPNSLRG